MIPPSSSNRYDAIPAELRELSQWVAYRAYPRKNKPGKLDKVPINPATGCNASTTDPLTWASFEEAMACANREGLAGIGFVFTDDDPFVGVDFDDCIDLETGVVDQLLSERIDALATYTELSMSGTGVHCIARATLTTPGRKRGKVEMYDTGRFFATTGNHYAGTPLFIEDRQEAIDSLHAEVFGKENETMLLPSVKSASDDEILQRAREAKNGAKFDSLWAGNTAGYASQSEADLALCGILAFWTVGDTAQIDRMFRLSGLMREKWDEKRGAQTYGQRTVAKSIVSSSMLLCEREDSQTTKDKPLTDTGNAERLAERFGGSIRYCYSQKKFYVWTKKRWRVDTMGRLQQMAKTVIRAIPGESTSSTVSFEDLCSFAGKSEKLERRRAMIELVKSEEPIPVLPELFDRDPWLLNCENGTVDLKTGRLLPHSRDDYITKLAPVRFDPEAKCPLWIAFLERVIPDDEVRKFIRRVIGYCLTGDVGEQVLFFCFGGGANGKSTFLGTIQFVIGLDYGIQAAPDLLLSTSSRNHPTEIADLYGVRMAVCMEVGADRSFDEPLIKQLTGGDRLKARRMREDFWEFAPTHKLLLGANHKPRIRGTDEAIWRRLILIPFEEFIPKEERDPTLPDKLKDEVEGILAWAVRGCLEWQSTGLCPPEQVQLAVSKYREDMDELEQFIGDCCVVLTGLRVGASDLFICYSQWCKRNDVEALKQGAFGTAVGERGFKRVKTGGKKVYVGIELTTASNSGGDHGGPSGPSSAINALRTTHMEGNVISGPDSPHGPSATDQGGAA